LISCGRQPIFRLSITKKMTN